MDTLTPGTVIEVCSWSKTPKECVAALLKAVEGVGKPRQDNTTVVVVDVSQKEEKAPPAAEPAAALATDATPEEGQGGGKSGLMIAIAAIVLLAGGGGAFFMMGGSDKAPVVEPITVATEQPAAAVAPSAPAAETETEPDVQVEAAPERDFQDKLKDGGDGPAMVRIPAGTFEMGSSGISVVADERPRREVKVKAFAIGKYEVTFADYERFAKATGREVPDNLYMDKETHPVLFVNWDDAYNYTQWLGEQTGESYRLPSEAEWEYAASGGTDTMYWWGPNIGKNRAHCFDCKTGLNPREPTSIGRFEASPFGLYDTAGNVQEWVHDCYHPNYQGAPSNGGIWVGGDCTFRVARGGAYNSTSKSLRAEKRSKWRSTSGYDTVGFRVVKDL